MGSQDLDRSKWSTISALGDGAYAEGIGFKADLIYLTVQGNRMVKEHGWKNVPWPSMLFDCFEPVFNEGIDQCKIRAPRLSRSNGILRIWIDISDELLKSPDRIRRIRVAGMLSYAAELVEARARKEIAADVPYPLTHKVAEVIHAYLNLPEPMPNIFEMREMLGLPIRGWTHDV